MITEFLSIVSTRTACIALQSRALICLIKTKHTIVSDSFSSWFRSVNLCGVERDPSPRRVGLSANLQSTLIV